MTCRLGPTLPRALWLLGLSACGITTRVVEERDATEGQGGANSGGRAGMVHAGALAGIATGGNASAIAGNGFGTAATGAGGKAIFGGGPGTCDSKFLGYEATCDAPPEPSPTWCLPTDGGGGGAGAADPSPVVGKELLIDDFEDSDSVTGPLLGGRGAWYTVNDDTGQQFPWPCALPSQYQNGNNHWEMRTYGAYFSPAPGGFANLGIALRSGAGGCHLPVDASVYVGMKFLLRGSGFVRFSIATRATNPVVQDGDCVDKCYDAHGILLQASPVPMVVYLKFSDLRQEGWGTPAVFDARQILGMQWTPKGEPMGQAPASCFDFAVDEVMFIR